MLKNRAFAFLFSSTTQVHPAPPGSKVYHDLRILGKLWSGWFMPADTHTTQPPQLGVAGSSLLHLGAWDMPQGEPRGAKEDL